MIRGRHPGHFGFVHARHTAPDGGYDYHRKRHSHGFYDRRRKWEIFLMLLIGGAMIAMLISLSLH